MLYNIVSELVNYAFLNDAGTFQYKKPKSEQKALILTLSLNVDYNIEEGYRFSDLVIYGGSNYIDVFTRERQDIAKKGKPYIKSNSPWRRIMHHDSCWRDSVRQFFFDYENENPVFSFPERIGKGMNPYYIVSTEELLSIGLDVYTDWKNEDNI